MQDLLQQAELELTRFVQVTDGRVSPESKKLLREIVYTNPYFREAGIIDEKGFLVHSTAAEIETPIAIPPDQRADPSVKSMQIVGLVQTSIMRERSIVLRLSTRGQGEVNVLVDPGLLTLLFRDVELGPGGNLLVVGPGGRALNVQSPLAAIDDAVAVAADPHLIRVTRTIPERQMQRGGRAREELGAQGVVRSPALLAPAGGALQRAHRVRRDQAPQTEHRPRSRPAPRNPQG